MERVEIPRTEPKPKQSVADWENEGGATPPHDFTANHKELNAVSARVRQTAFRLIEQVRARPLLSIAAAVGVGVIIGGGMRQNMKARSVLGLLFLPTVRRLWSAV